MLIDISAFCRLLLLRAAYADAACLLSPLRHAAYALSAHAYAAEDVSFTAVIASRADFPSRHQPFSPLSADTSRHFSRLHYQYGATTG